MGVETGYDLQELRQQFYKSRSIFETYADPKTHVLAKRESVYKYGRFTSVNFDQCLIELFLAEAKAVVDIRHKDTGNDAFNLRFHNYDNGRLKGEPTVYIGYLHGRPYRVSYQSPAVKEREEAVFDFLKNNPDMPLYCKYQEIFKIRERYPANTVLDNLSRYEEATEYPILNGKFTFWQDNRLMHLVKDDLLDHARMSVSIPRQIDGADMAAISYGDEWYANAKLRSLSFYQSYLP